MFLSCCEAEKLGAICPVTPGGPPEERFGVAAPPRGFKASVAPQHRPVRPTFKSLRLVILRPVPQFE
jgi:hypothetical protein